MFSTLFVVLAQMMCTCYVYKHCYSSMSPFEFEIHFLHPLNSRCLHLTCSSLLLLCTPVHHQTWSYFHDLWIQRLDSCTINLELVFYILFKQ